MSEIIHENTIPEGPILRTGGLWYKIKLLLSSDIFKDSFLTLGDQAVNSGTNFISGIIIGRTLSKDEFGIYTLCFSLILFFMSMQSAIISTPYTIRSQNISKERLILYTGSSFIHQLVYSVFAIIILIVVGFVLSIWFGSVGLPTVFWTLAVVITLILLKEYARQLCFAKLHLTTVFKIDFCIAVIQLGSLWMLAQRGVLSVPKAYIFIGGACGLPVIIWHFLTRKNFAYSYSQAVEDFFDNWYLAKWILASTVGMMICGELYQWILVAFHGAEANGILAACRGIIFIINPFILGMMNYITPKMAHISARQGRAALNRAVFRSTLFLLGPSCLLFLVIIIAGEQLVELMYGIKYRGYGHIVSLLVLNSIISVMSIPSGSALTVIERPDLVLKSYIVGVAVTLLFGAPLVKNYNVVGTVIAMILTTSVTAGIRLYSFWKSS